jgi:cytochrome c-type biogenesis protein CcmH
MTVFAAIGAALIAVALALIIVPMLRRREMVAEPSALPIYRDQLAELSTDLQAGNLTAAQFEESKRELERRVLEEYSGTPAPTIAPRGHWLVPAIVALALPLAGVTLYWRLGSPQAFVVPRAAGEQVDPGSITPEHFRALTQKLANALKKNPNDLQGWGMLARSYQALGRPGDAAQALSRALVIAPENPDVIADYAAAYQRKQYGVAIDFWERLAKELPEGSEAARDIRANIAEAKQAQDQSTQARKPGSVTVSGTVSLSPDLAAKAKPEDAVFIFARPVAGPRMPLAVIRAQAKDLPKAFVLDDSMAMTPTLKLSNFPEIAVEARVSKSGAAMPQSGDLQGASGAVKVGAADVKIVIDKVVP